MKTNKLIRKISTLVFAVATAIGLNSCASWNSQSTEQLLTASGFRARTPENAAQSKIVSQLPPYKVHQGTYKGKTFYAYKDPKQGVAYVGGAKEFQQYQQLAVQQGIAQDQLQTAVMNRDLAYGWYGAFGGYYYNYFGYPVWGY